MAECNALWHRGHRNPHSKRISGYRTNSRPDDDPFIGDDASLKEGRDDSDGHAKRGQLHATPGTVGATQGAKLQATGYDKAGRKQYLYHPSYRAAQEQAKYDKLIQFAEKLPDLRASMAEHLDKDALDRERVKRWLGLLARSHP